VGLPAVVFSTLTAAVIFTLYDLMNVKRQTMIIVSVRRTYIATSLMHGGASRRRQLGGYEIEFNWKLTNKGN